MGKGSNSFAIARASGEVITDNKSTQYAELPRTISAGEIIGVQVNTNTGTLNFLHNGQDLGQAFTSPLLKGKVHAAVSMFFPGDQVRLLGIES